MLELATTISMLLLFLESETFISSSQQWSYVPDPDQIPAIIKNMQERHCRVATT